ncbi:gamma-type small acid-soluble spore protein [Bacillus cereus]|nr:gamma-type small acid-soluble spore protein [Bacillus cereus]MCC2441910.1 gamma-type small acid-soluble spore protein [Bacillus paranthracis]MCC2463414.1 gamma-type small acid-soluble spore protein [Bacillus mobilis]MCC2474136.1 gamma-type small acid-soluble spore protein [Bacillus pacificus]MCC2397276.1 gamma-type small acid-soluble spore protein [Bacillus cereus]
MTTRWSKKNSPFHVFTDLGTEFASETDVNAVKKANAQSTAHKLNRSNNQH